jgi:hypothetical protein
LTTGNKENKEEGLSKAGGGRSTRMSGKAKSDIRTKKNEKHRSRERINEERQRFRGNAIVLVQTL